MRSARILLLGACLLVPAELPVGGAETRVRLTPPGELARGSPEGVAVSRQGRLFLAPELTRVRGLSAEAAAALSMMVDGSDNIYVGTGPAGRVLKLDAGGRSSVFLTTDEPLVTALGQASDGSLLVGTAPGGVIYRVDRNGRGERWSETGERYVWSLVTGRDGAVYAGTGEQGKILKIDRSGSVRTWFDSDEPHIVSLLSRPDGGLLAGGAGRGAVYQIDDEGNGLVLHEDILDETVSLEVEPDGSVLAAFMAAPPRVTRPPALRLRFPDGTRVGAVEETVTLEDAAGPTLHGVIEGLPPVPRAGAGRVRGRIVRIGPEGEAAELWSSASEAPFCLGRDGQGRAVFGTGHPARLYRLEAGGDVSLLATLREGQVSGMSPLGRSLFLATSNPAAVYRAADDQAGSGVFLSAPIDAGGPARWGTIAWSVDNVSSRVELYTRTGNSATPDATWSAWGPALIVAEGSRIDNPDGRYLQWRARFGGSSSGGTRLSSVEVRFEPYNRPPWIGEFRVEAAAVTRQAVFRWSVDDPDGDLAEVLLQYRRIGARDWIPVDSARKIPAQEGMEWDTTAVEEGLYEVRAVATDEAANQPGEGQRVPSETSLRVTIDRTPPDLVLQSPAEGRFEVTLDDTLSTVGRLQLWQDDRRRFSIRSEDGVCDSSREVFRFEVPGEGSGWSVRGVDAAGNVTERPLPQP